MTQEQRRDPYDRIFRPSTPPPAPARSGYAPPEPSTMATSGARTTDESDAPRGPEPAARRTRRRGGRTLVAASFALAVAASGTIGGAVAGSRTGAPTDAQVETVEAQEAPVAAEPEIATAQLEPGTGNDVSSLVAEALPGIVRITAQSSIGEGAGTGFVMSTDGRIATNAHVVAGSTTIDVEFADGTTSPAVVLGVSPRHDLAVLEVDRQDLTALPVGKSADLRVGQPVVAIGNALGFEGGHTATDGIVSALDRSITLQDGSTLNGLIQTDAAINPGNSGGPLLSLDGSVIGINSAGSIGAQNIGFAIEIDAARPILDQLAAGEPIVQAFLGIATAPIDPRVTEQAGLDVDHGLFVTDVTVGSAAEIAGLRRGDIVVAVGGIDVKSPEDLGDAIGSAQPGDQINLDVRRGDQSIEIVATLGRRVI